MEQNEKNKGSAWIRRLYGGLNMSWGAVLLLAVGTAVLTAVFLVVPVFKDSSFELMGVQFEAWIFFAVLIMANCKKPLESACKTFVFFLVSQPLIYLFQVPFSWMGWGLFGYYRFWFILTLLTFPAAYVGWYITKRNWLSVLILAPILVYLGMTACQSALSCLRHFPHLLVTALFCLAQIGLYAAAFMPGIKKLAGLAVPLAAAIIVLIGSGRTDVSTSISLPDDPPLTENAVVVMDEGQDISVTVERSGDDSVLYVRATRFGAADFVIRDGDAEYRYTVEVYEDEGGHTQLRVTER